MFRDLARNTIFLMVAYLVSSGLNLLFYKQVNYLSISNFGLLVTLITIINIIYVFGEIVTIQIAKLVAKGYQINIFDREIFWKILITDLLLGGLVASLMYLFIDTTFILPLLIVPSLGFIAIFKGILRGKKNLKLISRVNVLEAVAKSVLGIIAFYSNFNTDSIIVGFAAISILEVLLFYSFNKRIDYSEESKIKKFKIGNNVLISSFIFILLNILLNIDVLTSHNALSSNDHGLYSAVITYSKFAFVMISSTVSIVFMDLINNDSKKDRFVMMNAFGMVIIIGCLIAFGYFIFSDFAIKLLLGEKFLSIGNFIVIDTLGVTVLSLITLIVNYYIARHNTKFLFLMILSVLGYFLALNLLNTDFKGFIISKLTYLVVIFLPILSFYFYEQKYSRK